MTITPETEEALAESLRERVESVAVCSGGTRGGLSGGVSVAGLSGVRLYEPGALTLVVGAGTPVAEVERVLAAEGQRLAFEPMDHRVLLGTDGVPTIGGCVAMGAAGPRAVQVGQVRDHVLGARFVDGAGRVVRSGGRVMKNVTGLDLAKALVGSRGALGVVTEVSMKVLPGPEAVATVVIEADAEAALAVMQRAIVTPWEVSGAAWAEGRVMLRLEGFADQVAYRSARLIDHLGAGELADVDWAAVRDVAMLADAPEVWRVSLRATRMADVVRGRRAVLDRAGALAWVACGGDLRAEVAALGGHAERVKGGVLRPELSPAERALTQGLLHKFDPKGLFSPQRSL